MASADQMQQLSSVMNPEANRKLVEPKGGSTGTSGASLDSTDSFLSGLRDQMQSLVSSHQSEDDLKSLFSDAISGIKSGTEASKQSLDLQYGHKEDVQSKQNAQQLMTAEAGQRGFATNTALLKQIQDSGKEAINNLEDQKQSLILQGQAAAAGQIAGLQVQQAQLQLQQRNQLFSNLVSLAGVAGQQSQLNISRQQLGLQQQQAENDLASKMGTIALQYGIEVKPGDDIGSVVNRAASNSKALFDYGLQDAAAGLTLKSAQAQLYRAQAAAAGRSNLDQAPIDFTAFFKGVNQAGGPNTPGGANMISNMTASLASKPDQLQKFFTTLQASQVTRDWSKPEIFQTALTSKANGDSYEQFVGWATLNGSLKNKSDATAIGQNVWGQGYQPNYVSLYAQEAGQKYGSAASTALNSMFPGVGSAASSILGKIF